MSRDKKSKEELTANLTNNLPAACDITVKKPNEAEYTKDTEEDYRYSREKIKSLIDKADNAIDSMMNLALDAEHPRAFEVLSTMLKNASDMTMELTRLQQERKKLHDANQEKKTEVTNNSIFVGSTTELQKFIASQKKEILIDDAESI